MKAILKTARLTLKPLSPDDADLVVELFTDPVVKKHTGGPQSEASIREEMRVSTRRGGNGCIGIWTIVRTEDGEKLGTVALLPMPVDTQATDFDSVVPGEYPDAEIEIGFFLKPSVWRQGYAVEACRRVLGFVFEESPLTEIVANFDPANSASRGLLTKLGFVDRGFGRAYGVDAPRYTVTRDHWLAEQENG
ncbi:MAG: GNAT family N-acetyltransferase [Woeseiaceae bacterium]|nr:GNAT family N-acetyltransferase [Woeseiaceae bacterium]